MKILWISPFLLHPTRSGSQIRSLGMLRELHKRNEVHFAALVQRGQEEGLARSSEYSSRSFVVPHYAPHRASLRFVPQLVRNLFARLPLPVTRYVSRPLREVVARRLGEDQYDVVVSDFLFSAANSSDLERTVLFQHNAEAMIWERLAQHAPTPAHRVYFRSQAKRMRAYERECCQRALAVLAVSEVDAEFFRKEYGATHVWSVSTGVDTDYFKRPDEHVEPVGDLVFTGGMDWLPNIEGVLWFCDEILPLIRRRRPGTSVVIAGRNPQKAILELVDRDHLVRVTGTVPDIRPWLWGGSVCIVPLRSGSGTRLKIYEAMAAGTPVVSTTVGAEGLTYTPGRDLLIADTPSAFADACLGLLDDPRRRAQLAEAGRSLTVDHFSWAAVSRQFENLLLQATGSRGGGGSRAPL